MSKKNDSYKELYPLENIPKIRFKVVGVEQPTTTSNQLLVPPPSVNVHLLRYGLCKSGENHQGRSLEASDTKPSTPPASETTSYKSYTRSIGDNEVVFNPENAPEMSGYQYYGAPVREGWIYVYNETTDNWNEYKILLGGELQMVVWDRFTEGYDEREPKSGASSVSYLKVLSTHVIWLAYSEIQWTSEYTRKVVGSDDERKKRMQRINCNNWLAELQGQDLLSTAQVRAEFVEYNGSHNIAYGVYARDYQLCKALQNNDHHLYVYLHDPLGVANDLTDDLAEARLRYECLIKSMQTGVKEEDIYKHMTENSPLPLLENSDQSFALHTLTTCLYPLLFDPRNEDTRKYAKHVDKAKFEALLATEIRAREKEEIEKIRTALAEFMSSDYFVNIKNDAQDNTHTNRLLYLEGYHTRHNILVIPPAAYDYHLDIHSDSTKHWETNSEVKSYFEGIMKEGSWFDKLAVKEIDLADLIDKNRVGIANTLSQTWLTLLDAYPAFLTDASGKVRQYNCVAKWMENVKILGKKGKIACWEFENGQFRSGLTAHGYENETPLGKGRYPEHSTINRPPANMSRAPELTVSLAPKYQKWTENFLSHSGFKAVYRSLSFLNFTFLLGAKNEKGARVKGFQMSANAFEVSSLLFRALWEHHEQKQAIRLFAKVNKNYQALFATQFLRHLGTSVATGISGFLMLYDVVYYSSKRDTATAVISGFGSAITLSLATIGFAVGIQEMIAIGLIAKTGAIARAAASILALMSVSGNSASATAWRTVVRYGTKMWAFFILSVIILILLILFEKSELEKFVLNCVLSDYHKLPEEMKTKHPAEVMQYFHENKEKLTNENAAKLRNFVFALNSYEDLFPTFGMIADRGNYESKDERLDKCVYTMYGDAVYFLFYYTLPEDSWSIDLGLAITDHENVTYNVEWRESVAQAQTTWGKEHLREVAQPQLKSVKIPTELYLKNSSALPQSVSRIMGKMEEQGIPTFALGVKLNKWNEFAKYRNGRFLTLYAYTRLRYNVLWDDEQKCSIDDTPDTAFQPESSATGQAIYSVTRIPLRFTFDSIVAGLISPPPPQRIELSLSAQEYLEVIYYNASEQTIFKERRK